MFILVKRKISKSIICFCLCLGLSACSAEEAWDAVVEVADEVVTALGHLANIGTGGSVGQAVGLATSAVDQCKKYMGTGSDALDEAEETGDSSEVDGFLEGFNSGLHSLDGANAIDSIGHFIDICDKLVDELKGTDGAQQYLTEKDLANMSDVKLLSRKLNLWLDAYEDDSGSITASRSYAESSLFEY